MLTKLDIKDRLSTYNPDSINGDVYTARSLLGALAPPELKVLSNEGLDQHFGISGSTGNNLGIKNRLVPASVLIPIIIRDCDLTVLFTRRSHTLNDHAGQISFPGGKVEVFDNNRVSTALREAKEEVGLNNETVEVLGCLGPYITGTNFEVTPVVGFVSPAPAIFTINKEEVAEIFELPLNYALDLSNYEKVLNTDNRGRRGYYVIQYEQHRIWGATAAMLMNLSEVLQV
ncbi:MAG: CoA pyrophosphatase [Rhodospirillaceae bacterium]|nr:CoA pyrophosphatase [Rhodospirillaceae bacterium]